MKFTPPSKAASMMRNASSASVWKPKVMVPRQISETRSPVRPMRRCFILLLLNYSQRLVELRDDFIVQALEVLGIVVAATAEHDLVDAEVDELTDPLRDLVRCAV